MDERNMQMDFRKIYLVVIAGCFCITTFADTKNEYINNRNSFHIEGLYLQPDSNNLKYAVFVAGNQPYKQSWHNQTVNPGYSPGFEVGINYAFQQTPYNVSADRMHVGTSDSSSMQASDNIDISTVQFVAPPYDVGPAVFGIKRATSTVTSNFNSIDLDLGRIFAYDSHLKGRVFAGLNILNIKQNISTTFSDYRGSPEIPDQAYGLPADPAFYFTTKNSSDYLGVGPNLGLNIQYQANNGLGIVGEFVGALTVGTISSQDNFISASKRLNDLGINPSQQEITVPNATQFVPGLDSKLGLFYSRTMHDMDFTIEAGYRFAYYFNAISTISPDTLVQPGLDATIPEFATGTMAINSTTTSNSPYSLQGPYLNLTVAFG
jgi:hypothetical protein